jgi:hypothetical protein
MSALRTQAPAPLPLREPLPGETGLSGAELLYGLAADLICAKGRIGIYTLDDLRDRCVIDQASGCWNYRPAHGDARVPRVALPVLGGRTVHLGAAICVLRTGKLPERGVIWCAACNNPRCANPAHRKPHTMAWRMRAANIKRSPLTRARMSRAKRTKLTDQAVLQIAASSGTHKQVAAQFGISWQYAGLIRRGERRPYIVAPGASVFSMGQGA